MSGKRQSDGVIRRAEPYNLDEAVSLRDEQGWGWARLAARYGMSECFLQENVAPFCKDQPLPAGLTEEQVRAAYAQYARFPNFTDMEERTGVGRHTWVRAFRKLDLPLLKPVRRKRRAGVYTTVDGPRCQRCGIMLVEERHRGNTCVECLLEEAGRPDLALDNRGYLLTKGILPTMPEKDVDELLAQIGVCCGQVEEVREVEELVLEMA